MRREKVLQEKYRERQLREQEKKKAQPEEKENPQEVFKQAQADFFSNIRAEQRRRGMDVPGEVTGTGQCGHHGRDPTKGRGQDDPLFFRMKRARQLHSWKTRRKSRRMPRSVCSSCTFLSSPCQRCCRDEATVPKPGSSPGLSALLGSQPSWVGKWGTLHSPLTPQLLPGLCMLIFFSVNKTNAFHITFPLLSQQGRAEGGKVRSSCSSCPLLVPGHSKPVAEHSQAPTTAQGVPQCPQPMEQGTAGWLVAAGGPLSPLSCSQMESPVSPQEQPPGWVISAG